ncbi:hypothetical protein [Enterovirga sp. CN4-39]|uniref:hypothetical protein n=1 Tax=Enterovirga sp. CN4-39 TaxID=3400910 RepID=UPI003C0D20C2
MARRIVLFAEGMRISKPGFDALTTGEENLLFSTSRGHLMQLGAGIFVVPGGTSGIRIEFGRDVGQAPMVKCGRLDAGEILFPVHVYVDQTGFWAVAGYAPNGTQPAAGITVRWVAFMRQQG